MRKRPDFIAPSIEQLEAHIKAELQRTLEIGYTARWHLYGKFWVLQFNGHKTPFERIGEIIFEFEHWLQYTFPDDEVGRYFYEDLIQTALETHTRNKPKVSYMQYIPLEDGWGRTMSAYFPDYDQCE